MHISGTPFASLYFTFFIRNVKNTTNMTTMMKTKNTKITFDEAKSINEIFYHLSTHAQS